MKSKFGFTLIEFTFVLAIIGIFAAMSAGYYISMETKGKLDVMEIRVYQTQRALDSFIQTNCKRGLQIQPTIADLLASGYIPNASALESPFTGTPIQFVVDWNSPFSQSISIDIGDNQKAQDLRQAADATNVVGTQLNWVKSFGYRVERDIEGARNFRKMFEPECN